jgi:hypothetical protein
MADFNLGRIKFKWRGDWSTSTSYLIDDIIKYGGNTYVCTVNHTSLSTSPGFYTDLSASKWSLHTEGLFFKGNWAGSTHYKLNDLVKVGAYQYRTTTQHTSSGTFDASKFEIYTEGLQWEDSYNAGTTYSDGDVVTYGGYTYIYINSTASSGNTPTDNEYWDLLTTGFKSTGTYSDATAYKTGDTIVWGGNAYVCIINTTAGQSPYSHGANWQLISEGLKWTGSWSNLTTYKINEAAEYSGSSYVSLQNGNLNITPGTNGAVWSLLTQGDPNIVLTTRGDITYRNASGTARLPVGVAGTVLTSNGLEPIWADPSNFNTLYVSNSGSDSIPGTQFLPFRTIKYALSQTSKSDILEIGNISGGIGGAAGTYDVTGSGGSGTGFTARITLDGTNPPSTSDIEIINGGKNYTVGNTITVSASQIGGSPANNITFDVVTVSIGDLIQVQNGVYKENMPLVVPANVTISGESLRGTEVRPASGSSSTVATGTFALTTSWQRFSISGTLPSNTNQMGFWLQSTPSGTAGASDYFEVAGVQVEEGSTATPFSRNANSLQGELAACQRYYQRIAGAGATNNFQYYGYGMQITTTSALFITALKVTMRVAPEVFITTSNVTNLTGFGEAITSTGNRAGDGNGVNNAAYTAAWTIARGSVNAPIWVYGQINGFIEFNAEL